jgi:hypothetical protein
VQLHAQRRQELQAEIEKPSGRHRARRAQSFPINRGKLREAVEELARLVAQAKAPIADVERLIPQLAEEIERAVRQLPITLAAGNVDLARHELKGYLGSIRVAEPTRMLLYSERGFVEAAVMRAGGTMEVLLVAGAGFSNIRRRRALRRAA